MVKTKESAAPFVPEERKLPVLAEAVQKCKGCDLYKNATQAVFGEIETRGGAKPKVAIMMIGEQPGDQEDKQGRPFVGPAGKLLDKALEEAEIDRGKVYVTNAVKPFQVGAARQAAHPQKARHEGDQCVPSVAGCRIGDVEAEADCGPGRYRGARFAGVELQDYAGAWEGAGGGRNAADYCDAASFSDLEGADG